MEGSEHEKIPFIDERDNNRFDTANNPRNSLNHTNTSPIGFGRHIVDDLAPPSMPERLDSTLIPLIPLNPEVGWNASTKSNEEGSDANADGRESSSVSSTSGENVSVHSKTTNNGGNLSITIPAVTSPEPERRTSSFKFQIHSAAENGNVKELERLLKLKGDPLQTDFKRRTPLHYACGVSYQKKAIRMTDIILKCKMTSDQAYELINSQDNHGETPLHIAARMGHKLLVEKLIFLAADVNLKDKNGVEPLHLIYSKVPAAMIPVFDGALECKVGDPNDENLQLRFDFGSIVGYPEPHKDTGMFDYETKLLSYCLQQSESKRAAVMLHPVVQVFLHLKWKKIRILLWISILYHVIWLLLYTLFITDLYLRQCPYKLPESGEADDSRVMDELTINQTEVANSSHLHNEEFSGTTESDISWDNLDESIESIIDPTNSTNYTRKGTDGTECAVGRDLLSSLNIELSFMFYVTVSVVIKELYEMYTTPQLKFYFNQLENVGQWALISVVVLTSIPIFMEDDDNVIVIKSWQYQAAALGIFLAWSLILSQIGKIPKFAIYIEILGKVLKSFTLFMITFASLLVAFLVSFQILMPNKVEFSNFPWGFIKILVMMAGEINYDDIFFDDESTDDIPFPLSSRLLYAAFVAVVTIILFNLLIGLTVSDIQGLESVAQLSNLSSQLEQIYLIEKFIISKKVQRWLVRFGKNHWLRYFLVTQQTDDPETYMGIDIHISKIPTDLQYKVRELATPSLYDDFDDVDPKDGKSNEDEANGPRIEMNEENLKRIIKDVLRELLDEQKITNIRRQSQTFSD